jgi:hypothetical protein
MASPLPSKDGKKLFVVGSTLHGTLSRYDRRRGEFLPFFSGLSAEITTLLFQRRKVDRLRYLSCRKSLAQPGGRQRAAAAYRSADLSSQPTLVARRKADRILGLQNRNGR